MVEDLPSVDEEVLFNHKIVQPLGASKAIIHKMTIGEKHPEVFTIRFDPEDKYIAAGYADGVTRIFNIATGKMITTLSSGYIKEEDRLPITSLRWKPIPYGKASNILITCGVDGTVSHWQATNGKCLHTAKLGFDLLSLDYNMDGTEFAVAGKDHTIRIFDEVKLVETKQLKSGGQDLPGHANRIFSVKFTETPNVLVSGGWDKTIKIWDLREAQYSGSLYGPNICGDAIDCRFDMILTGSNRSSNAIEMWSLGKREKVESINWAPDPNDCSLVYSTIFDKGLGNYILAGGSGVNEAKLWDRGNGNSEVGAIRELPKPCLTCDMSNKGNFFSIGCGDGLVRVFEMIESYDLAESVTESEMSMDLH